MDESEDRFGPELPAAVRPKPEEVAFDLDRGLSAVLSLRATVPEDAFTARTLGTERGGNGVLIRENGLVLTIGYLITEADTVWLFDGRGRAIPAHVVGYDQETGFGLVQALQPLDLPELELGSAENLGVGDPVILSGCGGRAHAVSARVVARREFAGYWEYVLDNAIFTAPPHPLWGGAALIGVDGTLRGIGSLFVQQMQQGRGACDVNMVVPIDILKPILDELVRFGRTQKPPRPWLGMLTTEVENRIVVAGVIDGGPAQEADLRLGDIVVGVAGTPVPDMVTLFRRIWSLGTAGVEVPLDLIREGEPLELRVRSIDRASRLKAPRMH